jgi:glycosyltransferase involved in cell wall biosynthesis
VKPARIAIDYTAAVRQGGGIGRYTRGLVHALAAEPADGDRYVLWVAGHGRDPDVAAAPHMELLNLRLDERYLNILWHRASSPFPKIEWLTGPVDLVHSPNFVLPPVARARTVVTVHDLSFMRVPTCAQPSLRRYLLRVAPQAVRRADLVLADSQSTRQDVIELMGVAPDRVDVVPAGVEPRFRPINDPDILQQTRQRYNLGVGPLILSLGTLEPRKNFSGLMEAFAVLRERERIPHRLVIAGGKGWLYEGIFETAQRLNLGDAVHFAGFVADEDLPALYNTADLFAFPTRYEGFGLPVLEAMACGIPSVTANNSCMPELVGDAALLVDAADTDGIAVAMAQALLDPAVRQRLQLAGFARAHRFGWREAARKLRASYAKVLGR